MKFTTPQTNKTPPSVISSSQTSKHQKVKTKIQYKKITLLDDILRTEFLSARNFIYTLIEEPIKQASDIQIPSSRNFPFDRGLSKNFDIATFKTLCNEPDWVRLYNKIPNEAELYLIRNIEQDSLVIGYEMPPWLTQALSKHGFDWLDIRLSPIRFARDLYLIINSNRSTLRIDLNNYHTTSSELRLEAGLLKASILHNSKIPSTPTPEEMLLFIGQTKKDASLVSESGCIYRIDNFAEKILTVAANKSIDYKPHPYDKDHSRTEVKKLHYITGKKPRIIKESIYQLLAGRIELEILAISSGVLQEAPYFDRKSHPLFKPVCNLDDQNIIHIRFSHFISPSFWEQLITGKKSNNTLDTPNIQLNQMRRLHNAYWGYADYMLENDLFYRNMFKYEIKRFFSKIPNFIAQKIQRNN